MKKCSCGHEHTLPRTVKQPSGFEQFRTLHVVACTHCECWLLLSDEFVYVAGRHKT
jgi:hypothetical protein